MPHNLTLIVAGKLASGIQTLLNVVQEKVEPSLIEHGQNQGSRPKGWKRPFIETPSAHRTPLSKTIKEVVEFPEKDESVGGIQISWQGPLTSAFLEYKVRNCMNPWMGFVLTDHKAIDILGSYLTSSATAPLNKEYIEVENPLW